VGVPAPSACALTQAGRRLGVKPLQFLFDLLRGPAITTLSTVSGGGVYWRGLLVYAIDGTIMSGASATERASSVPLMQQRPGSWPGRAHQSANATAPFCAPVNGTRLLVLGTSPRQPCCGWPHWGIRLATDGGSVAS